MNLTDARGYKAEMVYDPFGRQRFWYFPMPGATGAANANDYEEYRYDAQGNRTSFRKRDGRKMRSGRLRRLACSMILTILFESELERCLGI